jgi:hypothetical protein
MVTSEGRNSEPQRSTGPFTRALLCFFAGTCLFFANGHIAVAWASHALSLAGSLLFLVGFGFASFGIGQRWRDMAAKGFRRGDDEDP